MQMKIQTNWIVFSGVTSSGKTTIADLSIRYGYKAPTEVARKYISELQTQMISEALSAFVETYEFQYEIARRGLLFQQELESNDIIIIDCGLLGAFVYFQLRGHTIQKNHEEPLLEHLNNNRYRGVFLFEKLPCDSDHCRFSTAETLRDQAHELIKEVNFKQGYTFIEVPIGSVEERLEFVLEKIVKLIPTLMLGYGLKQPSGQDQLTLHTINTQDNKPPTKMVSYGSKLYSGAYSSLFFGNGANCINESFDAVFMSKTKASFN